MRAVSNSPTQASGKESLGSVAAEGFGQFDTVLMREMKNARDALVFVEEHVDVLEGFHGIACGDVVLVVDDIGDIACGPDTRV